MVSGHRNVRGSNIITASAAVIALLILPLTVTSNNNDNPLLQSKSAIAQVQEGGAAGTTNTTTITNDTTATTESTDFLPYENPTYGIFVQYPSNWMASTSGFADYTNLIAFYSPLQNLSDSFPARLTISLIIYAQNISLPQYTDSVLTILNQSEQADVRSSSEVTVAGYPGHRVVLATQPFQNSTLILYQMSTWTTIGNKVYLLTYEGEESKFNQHLPEVSQIVESLSISRNNTT